jgi:predicted amidohydrolase
MKINHTMRCLVTVVIGLAVSSAQPAGIVAAFLLLPAFTFLQPSRRSCYAAATGYYAGALWPLAVGAKNFFGPDVSVIGAMAFWAVCTALLALPYALLWTEKTQKLLWRAPVALLIGAIPPLGLIGFASPLTASGFLFPAWSWAGLALSLVGYGLIVAYPSAGFLSFTAVALVANILSYRGDLKPPSDWQAVDTHFGGISHGPVTPLREYLAAQTIQDLARASSARVVVFPESVVPRWTASTDLFWKPAIDALRRDDKIVLIGALIPESLPLSDSDFRGVTDLLRTAHEGQPVTRQVEPYSYSNVAIIRGAQSGIFLQRVPVPISVWKPLSHGGAPLHLVGPAVVELGGERAALLICYEQVIPWTVLTAALAHPTLFVGMSNDHWATGTPIQQWQALCLRAWSRLFCVPYLLAVNT